MHYHYINFIIKKQMSLEDLAYIINTVFSRKFISFHTKGYIDDHDEIKRKYQVIKKVDYEVNTVILEYRMKNTDNKKLLDLLMRNTTRDFLSGIGNDWIKLSYKNYTGFRGRKEEDFNIWAENHCIVKELITLHDLLLAVFESAAIRSYGDAFTVDKMIMEPNGLYDIATLVLNKPNPSFETI